MYHRQRSTFVIVLVAVGFVSLSAILIRLTTAPVFSIGFYRMVMSALLLLPFALFGERVRLKPRTLLLTVISGAFLGAHFAAWIAAIKSTSVVHATVLVTMHPVIVVTAEALSRKRRPPWIVLAAVVGSLSGAIILASGGSSGGVPVTLRGDLLALLGAVAIAVYMLIGKRVRGEVPGGLYNVLVYSVAALVLFFPTYASGQLWGPFLPRDIVLVFALALFCTLLGHSVFNWALRYISASFVSMAILLEPLFASVLAVFFFGEYPGPVSLVGAVLVFSGVWIVAHNEMPRDEGERES